VAVDGPHRQDQLIGDRPVRPPRGDQAQHLQLALAQATDTDARRDILRSAGKSIPLSDDVDLDALAADLDGYSAADCVALLREAALTAMRRSIDAADVTAADVAKAREAVRPSLDPLQVESLRAFGETR